MKSMWIKFVPGAALRAFIDKPPNMCCHGGNGGVGMGLDDVKFAWEMMVGFPA